MVPAGLALCRGTKPESNMTVDTYLPGAASALTNFMSSATLDLAPGKSRELCKTLPHQQNTWPARQASVGHESFELRPLRLWAHFAFLRSQEGTLPLQGLAPRVARFYPNLS